MGVWLLAGFLVMMSFRTTRESIVGVIKAVFATKVLSGMALMIVYTIGIVAVLNLVSFWNMALLKETVFWFFFTAMASYFSYATSKTPGNVFRDLVIRSIKVVVIIEFLVNTYTFSLIVELLLVPFVAFIAMVDAVARTEEDHALITNITMGLQIIVSLIIVVSATLKAIADYENLGGIDTVRSLLLPAVLTVLFSPCLYLMLLLMNYEELFVRLKLGPEKDKDLKRYAKRRIILHNGFRLKRAREFLKSNSLNLIRIRSRDDVDKILRSPATE